MWLMLGQGTIDSVLNMASTNCRSLHIHLTKEVSGTKEAESKLMMIKSYLEP
jgi:flagellar biosynthesis chaperone FliJ